MLFVCYPKCSTCQKAKAWLDAREAMRLQPNSSETHHVMGLCFYWLDGDYDRALELAPGSVAIRVGLCQELLASGHMARAEEEVGAFAGEWRPWDVDAVVGELRYRQGRYGEAFEAYRSALEKAAVLDRRTQQVLHGNIGHCLRKLGLCFVD